jgi:hypothetical protein
MRQTHGSPSEVARNNLGGCAHIRTRGVVAHPQDAFEKSWSLALLLFSLWIEISKKINSPLPGVENKIMTTGLC